MIGNTAPLKNSEGKDLKRIFTGKTGEFKDKQERAFYTKMLKYYCKGAQRMPYGRNDNKSTVYVIVEQEYYYA